MRTAASFPAPQRLLCIRAIVLMLGLAIFGNSFAVAQPAAMNPAKAKRTLRNGGIGMGFTVKEVDGTYVTGILTGIQDDAFDLALAGTPQTVTLPFAHVSAIKQDTPAGQNMVRRRIVAAVVFGAVVSVLAIVLPFHSPLG